MAPKRHAVSNTGGGTAAAAASSSSPSSASQSSSKVTQRSTNSSSGLAPNSSPQAIIQHVWQRYLAQTPQRTLLLDAFMAFLVLVGGIQFVYCVLAGNYVSRMASCLLSPLCCGSAFVGFSAADH
jgi:oligosaccharyltransferase complex subunit epsilon